MKTDYKLRQSFDPVTSAEFDSEKAVFTEIMSNANGGVMLIALKKGVEMPPHVAPADVVLQCLGGEVTFTLPDGAQTLRKGDFLLMDKDTPHSVKALTDTKILLTKIKP